VNSSASELAGRKFMKISRLVLSGMKKKMSGLAISILEKTLAMPTSATKVVFIF
jgi:hypothetical protein